MSGFSGMSVQPGFAANCQVSTTFYVNSADEYLSLVSYAGRGNIYGVDLGLLSLDYGGGVNAKGMFDVSKFSSLGIGVGVGKSFGFGYGLHGGVVENSYIFNF